MFAELRESGFLFLASQQLHSEAKLPAASYIIFIHFFVHFLLHCYSLKCHTVAVLRRSKGNWITINVESITDEVKVFVASVNLAMGGTF
jgi:hypothetical protein